jgi:hypothetical protein
LQRLFENLHIPEWAMYQWQTRNGGVVLSDVLDLMYI